MVRRCASIARTRSSPSSTYRPQPRTGFTGASDVNLADNGAWITRRTVTLYAYDSGGDDGTTYKAKDRTPIRKSDDARLHAAFRGARR